MTSIGVFLLLVTSSGRTGQAVKGKNKAIKIWLGIPSRTWTWAWKENEKMRKWKDAKCPLNITTMLLPTRSGLLKIYPLIYCGTLNNAILRSLCGLRVLGGSRYGKPEFWSVLAEMISCVFVPPFKIVFLLIFTTLKHWLLFVTLIPSIQASLQYFL